MKRLLPFLALVLAALPLRANEPAAFIQRTMEDILGSLYAQDGSPATDLSPEKIRDVLGRSFDYELIIRRSLGRHGQRLSDTDRNRIADLTVLVLVRTYSDRFRQSRRPQIDVGAARELGQGRFEVGTTVRIDGTPYNAAYRVVNESNRWRVYDVVIEGVSLVNNFREQFDAHFQRGDAASLIAQLEQRLQAPSTSP